MKQLFTYLILSFSILYFSSCSEESQETGANSTIDSSSINKSVEPIEKDGYETAHGFEKTWDFKDEDLKVITITDKLSLGTGYKTAEQMLPDFKGVRAENKSAELANKGYTEGISETTLFGQKAICTFHFKEDSLISYDISVPIVDLKISDKKYNELKDFYTHKYGEAKTPEVEEDNYTKNTSYWKTPKGYILLVNDLSTGQIKFGRQTSSPK
jgi:hypothetical protein